MHDKLLTHMCISAQFFNVFEICIHNNQYADFHGGFKKKTDWNLKNEFVLF